MGRKKSTTSYKLMEAVDKERREAREEQMRNRVGQEAAESPLGVARGTEYMMKFNQNTEEENDAVQRFWGKMARMICGETEESAELEQILK